MVAETFWSFAGATLLALLSKSAKTPCTSWAWSQAALKETIPSTLDVLVLSLLPIVSYKSTRAPATAAFVFSFMTSTAIVTSQGISTASTI